LRFLQRHSNLETALTRSIEIARITEASLEIIESWYDVLFQTIDELGILWRNTYNCDESGFGIGKRKALRVVVDKEALQNYQAEPGRQEWVTVMECICADGDSIPPLIIFKGENVSKSWIPKKELLQGWHVSCNTKGWTSNEHGVEWLKKCFEPAIRDKADGQFRLLICDGHDSHISAEFIRHCISNHIVLLLLPPHCSHLMQPLDVGVFFPLKQAIGTFVDRIIQTGISRLQKTEWFNCFIKARDKAINKANIEGGWRGAGIYPMNPLKVLRKILRSTPSQEHQVPDPAKSTSTTDTLKSFDILLNNAPINANALHSANTALNDLVRLKQSLHTPARKFIPRLATTAEWLLAENAILKLELKKCQDMLGARNAREKGKWLVLKGKIVISTEEILKAIEEAEEATAAKKQKKTTGRPQGRPRKNAPIAPIVTLEEAADEEGSDCSGDD
jgi:DDE superfamily endonuclease